MTRRISRLQLLVFSLLIGLLVTETTVGQGEKKKPARELVESFKGKPVDPGKVLAFEFWGQNAENHVFFEPEGLRITLPAGSPKPSQNTGVSTTGLVVKGDFEVTVRYDILREPDVMDAGPGGTAFSLILVQNRKQFHAVGLSRKVGTDDRVPDGVFYRAYFQFAAEGDKKGGTKGAVFPTKAKSGRLRMVRTGPVLSYFVAEGAGDEFVLLRDFPFGGDDLKAIRVVGNTGGPKAVLDVRVTDLRIRLDGPSPEVVAPEPEAAVEPARIGGGWALLAAGIVGAAIIVVFTMIAAFVFWRRRGLT